MSIEKGTGGFSERVLEDSYSGGTIESASIYHADGRWYREGDYWYYAPYETQLHPCDESDPCSVEMYGYVRFKIDSQTGKKGEPELVSWI